MAHIEGKDIREGDVVHFDELWKVINVSEKDAPTKKYRSCDLVAVDSGYVYEGYWLLDDMPYEVAYSAPQALTSEPTYEVIEFHPESEFTMGDLVYRRCTLKESGTGHLFKEYSLAGNWKYDVVSRAAVEPKSEIFGI